MSKKRNAADLAADMGMAGFHAGVTMWYRLPMMAAAFVTTGKSDDEMTRMVSEKFTAVIEGAFDAQLETMKFVAAAVTGRLELDDFAGAPVTIATAGLRPAFRAVKANSRRLHRKHSG
jgi:hypothetical protein